MRIFVVKIREQFDYNRKSIRKFDNLLKGQGLGCYQPLLIIFGLFQKAREYKWKLVVLVHFGKTLDVIEREREKRERQRVVGQWLALKKIEDVDGKRHRRSSEERGKLHGTNAAVVPRQSGYGASYQNFRGPWIHALHVAPDLSTLPSFGLRTV